MFCLNFPLIFLYIYIYLFTAAKPRVFTIFCYGIFRPSSLYLPAIYILLLWIKFCWSRKEHFLFFGCVACTYFVSAFEPGTGAVRMIRTATAFYKTGITSLLAQGWKYAWNLPDCLSYRKQRNAFCKGGGRKKGR
jgi:hypothetical protein